MKARLMNKSKNITSASHLIGQEKFGSHFIWMVPYRSFTDAQIINKISLETLLLKQKSLGAYLSVEVKVRGLAW